MKLSPSRRTKRRLPSGFCSRGLHAFSFGGWRTVPTRSRTVAIAWPCARTDPGATPGSGGRGADKSGGELLQSSVPYLRRPLLLEPERIDTTCECNYYNATAENGLLKPDVEATPAEGESYEMCVDLVLGRLGAKIQSGREWVVCSGIYGTCSFYNDPSSVCALSDECSMEQQDRPLLSETVMNLHSENVLFECGGDIADDDSDSGDGNGGDSGDADGQKLTNGADGAGSSTADGVRSHRSWSVQGCAIGSRAGKRKRCQCRPSRLTVGVRVELPPVRAGICPTGQGDEVVGRCVVLHRCPDGSWSAVGFQLGRAANSECRGVSIPPKAMGPVDAPSPRTTA